ncbi:NAD-dependent epimerase/dehydratase family protein [Caballeronia sp. RCC_10]|uniref:NAD-dependent epimerase/dehydratase family protein n=1 Tax=Caballeronia sp. RCC_10 TaxID=3239227 RepID=UPI003526967D
MSAMHVVVTGAQGFVGRALVKRLLAEGLGDERVSRMTLIDVAFDAPHCDERVIQLTGNIADPATRARAYAEPVDTVFHLASVPGGAAEKNYELGRSINLDATVGLLEDLRSQPRVPRFVFASTVAVYGERLSDTVDETTLPAPALSYGAHKLMGEVLVANASRLGWIQGCSLRLPGVVARPGDGSGLMSAFMSQLFWRLAAGEPLTVPVSPEGVAWWISVGACVDNLLHAAIVDVERFNARRAYQMPVLRLTVSEVVDALATRFGSDRKTLVTYLPDPFIERLFATYPPLLTPEAEALGLRHDGDVDELITRAMAQ